MHKKPLHTSVALPVVNKPVVIILLALLILQSGQILSLSLPTVAAEERSISLTISATPIIGPAPLIVGFEALPLGTAPYNFTWVFGDGTASAYQNPVWYPKSVGTYIVNSTVTDSLGLTTSRSIIIRIFSSLNVTGFLNSFESKRTSGGVPGSYGTVQETSIVIIDYAILGKPVPEPEEIVAYMDSRIGSWAAPPSNNYWTTRVWWALATYHFLDTQPENPVDNLFSRIDTWDEALADTKTYAPTNFWGDMWAKITAWRLYYGVPPPWMDQYFSYSEAHVDSWMPDIHQRTHNFFVYWAQGREFPYLREAVNRTLNEQHDDGTWSGSAGVATETAGAVQLLNRASEQVGKTERIQSALSKSTTWLISMYVEQVLADGRTLAGFKFPPSNALDLKATITLTGTAVDLDLLSGSTDILFGAYLR